MRRTELEVPTTALASSRNLPSGSFRAPVPSAAAAWSGVDGPVTLPPISVEALQAAAGSPIPPQHRRPARWLIISLVAGIVVVGALAAVVLLRAPARAAVPVEPPPASATVAVVVQGAGRGGVALRAVPATSGRALGTAADGTSLTATCGEDGETVSDGLVPTSHASSTWLRVAEGRYVSLLYVRAGGVTTIQHCRPGEAPLSLRPVTQPSRSSG